MSKNNERLANTKVEVAWYLWCTTWQSGRFIFE